MEDLLPQIHKLTNFSGDSMKSREQLSSNYNSQIFNFESKQILNGIEQVKDIIRKNKRRYMTLSNSKFVGLTDEEKYNFENIIIDKAHKTIVLSTLVNKVNAQYKQFSKMKETRNQQNKLRDMLINGKKVSIKNQKNNTAKKNTTYDQSDLNQEQQEQYRLQTGVLLEKYQSDLKDAEDIQEKMTKLTQLMGTLSQTAFQQDMMTEDILGQVQSSVQNVKQGVRHIKEAEKHSSNTGVLWATYYITLGIVILLMDYLN